MAIDHRLQGQQFNIKDIFAISSGAAAGTVAGVAIGAALLAPVAVPVLGAVLGGAIGLGVKKYAMRPEHSPAEE